MFWVIPWGRENNTSSLESVLERDRWWGTLGQGVGVVTGLEVREMSES